MFKRSTWRGSGETSSLSDGGHGVSSLICRSNSAQHRPAEKTISLQRPTRKVGGGSSLELVTKESAATKVSSTQQSTNGTTNPRSASSLFSQADREAPISRPKRASITRSSETSDHVTVEDAEAPGSAPEEAVADPTLTIDLDLSEQVVGLKGRDGALQKLQKALAGHFQQKHENISQPQTDDLGFSTHLPSTDDADSDMTAVLLSGASGTGKMIQTSVRGGGITDFEGTRCHGPTRIEQEHILSVLVVPLSSNRQFITRLTREH